MKKGTNIRKMVDVEYYEICKPCININYCMRDRTDCEWRRSKSEA